MMFLGYEWYFEGWLYLYYLGYFFLVFIAAIIWHELGHGFAIMYKEPDYKLKVSWKPFSLSYSSDNVNRRVIAYGITFGFIPIIVGSYMINNIYLVLLSIPYLMGCQNDLKLLD